MKYDCAWANFLDDFASFIQRPAFCCPESTATFNTFRNRPSNHCFLQMDHYLYAIIGIWLYKGEMTAEKLCQLESLDSLWFLADSLSKPVSLDRFWAQMTRLFLRSVFRWWKSNHPGSLQDNDKTASLGTPWRIHPPDLHWMHEFRQGEFWNSSEAFSRASLCLSCALHRSAGFHLTCWLSEGKRMRQRRLFWSWSVISNDFSK